MQPTRQQNQREAMRRIHVGLGGLTAVVLLVSLTSIVIDAVREKDAAAGQADAALSTMPSPANGAGNRAEPTSSNEPLADLGVAPASEAGGAPVVPDLKPDSALKTRMDRDPGPASDPNRQ